MATRSATASSSAAMHSPGRSHFDVPAGNAGDGGRHGGRSSDDQVELTTVSRIGNDLVVRWTVHQDNGMGFHVYHRSADGQTVTRLTLQPLAAATRTMTIADQALTLGCGSLYLQQVNLGDPTQETGPSAPVDLDPGCGGGGSPPPDPADDGFLDHFHHRDHLGSLRLVTDEAGGKVAGYDWYPYGLEMATTAGQTAASRWKYTVHERDEQTGLDSMWARYKPAYGVRFLSPDPADDVGLGSPQSWNRYGYVMNSPLDSVDPHGLSSKPNCFDPAQWHDVECGGGSTTRPGFWGGPTIGSGGGSTFGDVAGYRVIWLSQMSGEWVCTESTWSSELPGDPAPPASGGRVCKWKWTEEKYPFILGESPYSPSYGITGRTGGTGGEEAAAAESYVDEYADCVVESVVENITGIGPAGLTGRSVAGAFGAGATQSVLEQKVLADPRIAAAIARQVPSSAIRLGVKRVSYLLGPGVTITATDLLPAFVGCLSVFESHSDPPHFQPPGSWDWVWQPK